MNRFIFAISLLLVPTMVSAHGTVTSLPARSGDFLVEFEYNKLTNIQAGDLVTFRTYLLDKNQQPVEFDGVYILITKEPNEVTLTANVQPDPSMPGSAKLTGIIKDAGEYQAEVHFNKAGNVIARANYNFSVDERVLSSDQNNIKDLSGSWIIAAAVLIGFFGGWILRHKKSAS